MKDFEVTISIRNNHLRERRGSISQIEMARRIGVNHGSYTGLECMRISPLTVDAAEVRRAAACIAPGCQFKGAQPMMMHRHLCLTHYEEQPSPETWRTWWELCPSTWKRVALKIAAYYDEQPEALWPNAVLSVRTAKAVRKLDGVEIAALSEDAAMAALGEPGGSPEAIMVALDARRKSRDLAVAMSTLTLDERNILKMTFGINAPELTLEQIGKRFGGVSRERIRQRAAKAIRKLRHPSRVIHIREWCDD